MQITKINVENFIGIRSAQVAINTPVCVFAGANGSGKSSLREAVRAALTSEPARVSLKKEFGAMLTDDAAQGFSEVEFADGSNAVFLLPDGTHKGAEVPAALPYVIDAQRFAHIADNDRRLFLFGLMGISISGATVKERLTVRGCDSVRVEAVLPLLRAGFDSAHKEAQVRARECKSAWRTVTGETYGDKKAVGWKAEKPDFDPRKLEKAIADLDAISGKIDAESRALGDMESRARAASENGNKLAGLRQKAGTFARIQDKLNRDEAELTTWTATVAETRAKASGSPFVAHLTCPDCGCDLELKDGKLVGYSRLCTTADPEAVAKLPEQEKALALMQSAVANGKRDLAIANAAAEAIDAIEKNQVGNPPTEDEITAARAHIESIKGARKTQQSLIDVLRVDGSKADSATEKTTRALALHNDVAAWDKVIDSLAPSGIPGDLLAEALGPINERLGQSAVDAEWPSVCIGADMAITADDRAYALLSESEQWRVDAMIAEAISHLSRVKLLVLDRFDVLDLPGRANLIAWLDTLATQGEVDTALIFGTLKSLPASLPESFSALWIENGVVGGMKVAT